MRLWVLLAVAPVILTGGIASVAAAQQTAADSARLRADSLSRAVPMPSDTLRRDTLLADTTHRRVSKADSILLSYHPDTTKTKSVLNRAQQPRLLSVGPSYHWDRNQLFASGVLTLADLLTRVVGFNLFSAGWLSTPMMGTYLGVTGTIRIYYDGVQLDPLDPGTRGLQDLAQVELWTLEEVGVEVGANQLRVYIRSWSVDHVTPTTRADVLTGNQQTNMYRAFFGERFKSGLGLQFAAQQFTNIGAYGGGGQGTSLIGRLGWAQGLWAFDAYVDRDQRGMDPLARVNLYGGLSSAPGLPDFEKTFTNAYVRGAFGSPDHGVWAQLIANTQSFKNTSPIETSTSVTVPPESTTVATVTSVDTTNSESQYIATGGLSHWGIRFTGTERVRVFGSHGAWSSPSLRLSWDSGPLAIEALTDLNDPTAWPTLTVPSRMQLIPVSTDEATARLTPLPFISLLADVARSTSTGAPDAPPTSTSMRGEAGIRIGQLWFAAGVIRRDTALMQGLAIYDTTFVPAGVGRMTGYYGTIRGSLFNNVVNANIYGIDYGSEGPYRPQFNAHAELDVQSSLLKLFPRNDFHIKVAGGMDYTSSVLFPTISGIPDVSSGAIVLNSLLEIRILQGTIFWQLRNLLGYPYNLVPGYIMPRAVNLYGIRWSFWN